MTTLIEMASHYQSAQWRRLRVDLVKIGVNGLFLLFWRIFDKDAVFEFQNTVVMFSFHQPCCSLNSIYYSLSSFDQTGHNFEYSDMPGRLNHSSNQ